MELVLSTLEKCGIQTIEDGYVTLPQEHCFSSWRRTRKKAEGSDGYALYWRVTYELRVCFRDGKTNRDKLTEEFLENEFRELDDLECTYGYNSDDKLDITIYTFTEIENFKEEF